MTSANVAMEPGKTGTSSDVKAAWAVVVAMGATSVTYQIYHAITIGQMNPYLAVLFGTVPTLTAALLSHIIAVHKGGWVLQAITFAVMGGAMALSINSTGAVVHTAAGRLWWLFGLVLDAAALVSLRVIFAAHERKRGAATALEIAEQAARDAATRAERAEAERAGLASETGRLHADLTTELERVRGELTAELDQARAGLTAELERARTELVTANATVEALRSARVPARKSRRGSARKQARTTGRYQAGSTDPVVDAGTGPEADAGTGPEAARVPGASTAPEGELDMDQEARLLILDYVAKGHSASEAGRLAGKTDSYGRQVVRLDKAAKTEPAGGERSEGDVS
jgi:hypothetical protein